MTPVNSIRAWLPVVAVIFLLSAPLYASQTPAGASEAADREGSLRSPSSLPGGPVVAGRRAVEAGRGETRWAASNEMLDDDGQATPVEGRLLVESLAATSAEPRATATDLARYQAFVAAGTEAETSQGADQVPPLAVAGVVALLLYGYKAPRSGLQGLRESLAGRLFDRR